MKLQMTSIFVIAVFSLMQTCGCTPSAKVSPAPNLQIFDTTFAGEWVNIDRKTNGITKVHLVHKENGWLIHGWGACGSAECNWESVPLLLVAEKSHGKIFTRGFAIRDSGFKTTYMTLEIRKDRLFIDTVNIFTDKSGRSNYFSTAELKRGKYN